MRAISKLVLCGVLLISGVAGADAGLALGPVVTQSVTSGSDVGIRGAVDARNLGLAIERYQFVRGNRTRAEFAVRAPLVLARGFRFVPQLGFIPLDYATFENGQRDKSMALTGTVGVSLRLGGPLWLVAEPLRIERRFRRMALSDAPEGTPSQVRDSPWAFSSFLGLRLGI